MSATQLAREFEVSARTIHRDIDQLSAAGVPVYADRGRSGGFALMDGYRTKLTGLTQPEAEALLLAGLPGPAAQLGFSDMLSAARLKLLAALPADRQKDAERVAQRFHLDPVGWFRESEPLPGLQIVARAVWSARMLRLRYRSNAEVYDRTLGPLGLVLKGGVWYLVAQSGKAVRTYRVAQIVEAEATDEPFARPRSFDLAAEWEKSSRAYEAGLYREEAKVRLSPKGLDLLSLFAPFAQSAAQSTAKPEKNGWIVCTLPIEPGVAGLRDLMRLGGDAEVLAPEHLRAAMTAMLKGALEHYCP